MNKWLCLQAIKPFVKVMRRIFIFVIATVSALCLCSCLKHDDGDRYYIRYEAEYPTSRQTTLRVATPKGIETFSGVMRTYSDEFGPVHKGFASSIVSSESGTLTISVRKNDGEYITKATGETAVNYTIDF